MIGKSFSNYKVLEQIGVGGMGEVYRGEDTALRRQVAIKVLPPHLLDDPERLARFEREAQVLASLDHPGIAAVYGLEVSEGHRCLVMELVEGEDLAQRLKRGSLPPELVVSIAGQLAEALEAAHERGVIHRDLKPANIKLRPDGRIKVLDFGLAKAIEGDARESAANLSASPTLTGMMTGANVILGTAAYMSPEQARGQVVDKRADIWAYGAVLFELLTGKQAFAGDTVSDTLASVLKTEPDWDSLPASTPPRLRRILERCLVKDPRARLRDIGEARIALAAGDADSEPGVGAGSPSRRGVPVWVAGVLTAGIAVAAALAWLLHPQPPSEVIQGIITVPEGQHLMLGSGGHLAFSPDGKRIAFAATDSNQVPTLWVRNLADAEAHQLSGTRGAINPFWSPDGLQLGFFAEGKMKRIPVAGGAPITVCDAPNGRGGTWKEDNTIVFAPTYNAGLQEVGASGGEPRSCEGLPAAQYSLRWPQRVTKEGLLFTSMGTSNGIFYRPSGDTARLLLDNAVNAVYHDGLLYYTVDNVLFARPFDPGKGVFTGDPQTVTTGITVSNSYARSAYSAAPGGRVAFVQTPGGIQHAKLALYSLDGTVLDQRVLDSAASDPALSPDGTRIAYSKQNPNSAEDDIWVLDLERGVESRLTFSGASDDPVWSPDGNRIAYASNGNIHVRSATGVGDEEVITSTTHDDCTHDWSPDGRYIVFSRAQTDSLELVLYDFETKAERVLLSGKNYEQGRFSRDGRWIAYISDESGHNQVYVQDFPDLRGRWQISGSGGIFPQWGKGAIVYCAGDRTIRRVAVKPNGGGLDIGKEQVLFASTVGGDRSIQDALTPGADGLWILEPLETNSSRESPPIRFVLNWQGN